MLNVTESSVTNKVTTLVTISFLLKLNVSESFILSHKYLTVTSPVINAAMAAEEVLIKFRLSEPTWP